MNVDVLEGEELDAMVAQRLFGREVQERTGISTGRRRFFYNARPDAPIPEWAPVPSYSASHAASLNVSLWLQEHGWKVLRTDANSSRAVVVLTHAGAGKVEAVGTHQYDALCRGALKALKQ